VSRIGGWWLQSEETREGESVLFSINANRKQGGRGVGGQLHVTTERLVFTPHLLDAAFRGETWVGKRSEIVRITKESPGLGDRFAGGRRARLRIELRSEPPQLFVVNKLDEVITRLRAAGG
jgi:hypothetical protein